MQTRTLKGVIAGTMVAFGMWLAGAASAQVLTFEGLKDQEPVLNFYNGGLGGSGSGPGPSYGITFVANSLALIEADQGGSGNFKLEPSPKTIVFFLTGSDIMNIPAGFQTGFSFYYTAAFQPGIVNVWSGLNATGTLLASVTLPVTGNGAGALGCNGHNFCPFVPKGVAFSGTALSVDFGGTANQIGFDNITLGSTTPGGSIPTLNEWTVMLLALLVAIIGGAMLLRG